jgi:hypothetical protein
MNQYKIDLNSYVSRSYPYALFVKRKPWWCWQYIESFRSVEEAMEFQRRLTALPIYLNGAAVSRDHQ